MFIVPRVRVQGLTRHYSLNRLARMLTLAIRRKIQRVVDKVLQLRRNGAQCVFFVLYAL